MTLFQAFGQFAGQAAVEQFPWEVVIPSSVSYTGTSATLDANGKVTIDQVTDLVVNDCFPTEYNHFTIMLYTYSNTSGATINYRMVGSGTPDTTANYDYQRYRAEGTTFDTGQNENTTSEYFHRSNNIYFSFDYIIIQNPNLAQQTSMRTRNAWALSNASIWEVAGRHTVSTAFDGVQLLPASTQNITGFMQIYGVRL